MEGVTILKVIPANPVVYCFGLLLLGAGIGFFIASIKMLFDVGDLFWIPLIFSLIFLFSSIALIKAPEGHQTSYKVTISDEVPMSSFYEHYEIVSQDGLIFTVRERE